MENLTVTEKWNKLKELMYVSDRMYDDHIDSIFDELSEKIQFPEKINFKIKEDTEVLILAGDRFVVGEKARVREIQPDGSCKICFKSDYMNDNINNIETNPFNRKNTKCDMIVCF